MFARNERGQLWLALILLLLAICNGTNHTDATPLDAVDSAKQAASDATEAIKKEASPPTFADKVKESLGKAGQQLQSYADQLAAQIPKRLRRQTGSIPTQDGVNQPGRVGATDNSEDWLSVCVDDLVRRSNAKIWSTSDLRYFIDKCNQIYAAEPSPAAGTVPQQGNPKRLRRQTNPVQAVDQSKQRGAYQFPETQYTICRGDLRLRPNGERRGAYELAAVMELCEVMKMGELVEASKPASGQLAPPRLRRQATAPGQPPAPPAGFLAGGQSAADALAALGEQVRNQTTAAAGAAVQQFQSLRDQLAASVERQIPKRARRQVQYPQSEAAAAAAAPASNGVMKYISDLGQQAQQAQAISQFLQAAGASGSQQPATGVAGLAGGAQSGGAQVAQVLTQLTDLIKSTQNRNARLVESGQRSLEATGQQTMEVAKSAQGGLQAAVSEMTLGLQKLAANNPNLVPDIKSLYQSVSAKLSPTASSAAQAAATPTN